MAEVRDASRLASYTSTIRELIAIAAGVGAIGYAAGFMVVTSHLMRWGIADLNLVKARYISVGFTFIIHVSLILLPASLAMLYIVQKISDALKRRKGVTSNDEESREGDLKALIALFGRIPRAAYAALAFVVLTSFISAVLLSLFLLYLTFWNRWLGGPSAAYLEFLSSMAGRLVLEWFLPLFGAGLLAPLIALNVTRNHRLWGLPNRPG